MVRVSSVYGLNVREYGTMIVARCPTRQGRSVQLVGRASLVGEVGWGLSLVHKLYRRHHAAGSYSMGLVDNPVWQVSLTFADRDRNTSVIGYNLGSALAFADAGAAMAAVNSLIVPLTDAALIAVSLGLGQYESTYPATLPPEGSDVERYVDFEWIGAVKPARSSIRIPSIRSTLIIDGSQTLNMTDAAVIAFRDGFINTGLGAGNSPVSNSGVDLVALSRTPVKKHLRSQRG